MKCCAPEKLGSLIPGAADFHEFICMAFLDSQFLPTYPIPPNLINFYCLFNEKGDLLRHYDSGNTEVKNTRRMYTEMALLKKMLNEFVKLNSKTNPIIVVPKDSANSSRDRESKLIGGTKSAVLGGGMIKSAALGGMKSTLMGGADGTANGTVVALGTSAALKADKDPNNMKNSIIEANNHTYQIMDSFNPRLAITNLVRERERLENGSQNPEAAAVNPLVQVVKTSPSVVDGKTPGGHGRGILTGLSANVIQVPTGLFPSSIPGSINSTAILASNTIANSRTIKANTMVNSHTMGTNTMVNSHTMGANTMVNSHTIGANTMVDSHTMGVNSLEYQGPSTGTIPHPPFGVGAGSSRIDGTSGPATKNAYSQGNSVATSQRRASMAHGAGLQKKKSLASGLLGSSTGGESSGSPARVVPVPGNTGSQGMGSTSAGLGHKSAFGGVSSNRMGDKAGVSFDDNLQSYVKVDTRESDPKEGKKDPNAKRGTAIMLPSALGGGVGAGKVDTKRASVFVAPEGGHIVCNDKEDKNKDSTFGSKPSLKTNQNMSTRQRVLGEPSRDFIGVQASTDNTFGQVASRIGKKKGQTFDFQDSTALMSIPSTGSNFKSVKSFMRVPSRKSVKHAFAEGNPFAQRPREDMPISAMRENNVADPLNTRMVLTGEKSHMLCITVHAKILLWVSVPLDPISIKIFDVERCCQALQDLLEDCVGE